MVHRPLKQRRSGKAHGASAEGGRSESIARPARWCRIQHDRLKASLGYHRSGWPPPRRPLKQRVFLSYSAHSAARRQRGWGMGVAERVRAVEVWSAARSSSAWPTSRTAPGRREDGRGWACHASCPVVQNSAQPAEGVSGRRLATVLPTACSLWQSALLLCFVWSSAHNLAGSA